MIAISVNCKLPHLPFEEIGNVLKIVCRGLLLLVHFTGCLMAFETDDALIKNSDCR